MELSNFFSAAEGRLDRWRTLHRIAKNLVGVAERDAEALRQEAQNPPGRHGTDRGFLRLSRAEADGAGARAPADRRPDGLRPPGAADQRRAAHQQLPRQPRGLEGGGGDRGALHRHPAAVDRPRSEPKALLRGPDGLARRAFDVAGDPGDLPAAAPCRGRVRLRAGRRRQLRGRSPRHRVQLQPAGGRDQRRLRVPLAVHRAGSA